MWLKLNAYKPQSCLCVSATEGHCIYPRGRVLGGSSGTNAMIYTRGYRSDYDKWGVDNCGWSFNDVRPYFLQSEGNRIPGLIGHGRKGPLTVSYAPYRTPLADQLIRAGIVKGLRNTDCPEYEGGCILHVMSTIRDGRRCSASTAYLEPISAQRSNLHIITGAEVSKVIIENNTAKGVEFVTKGQTKTVLTTNEVILSAGAINSPKILMLSGVGPKKHLEELGIPVKADLPVGDNLQDHVRIPIFFKVHNGTVSTLEDLADPRNQEEYLDTQTGPYSFSGVDALAWVRVGGSKNKLINEPPNVQYHFFTRSARADTYIAGVSTTVVRPKSRGTVRLSSNNSSDHPLIDVNYYGDRRDWQTALEGLQYSVDLFSAWPLTTFGATLDLEQSPLCKGASNLTEFLNCVIRVYTLTIYHPVGTAKMAAKTKEGVVNRNLQVYGINNLRVIDASIAPTLISMNTNAMAIMIGEKGADIIKYAYGKPTLQKPRTCTLVDKIISKFM